MDRADAIEILSQTDVFDEEAQEAFDMAIAALREQDATDINDGHKTNADRIRAMTDEELSENLCDRRLTKEMWLKWLQQPCGGADHD